MKYVYPAVFTPVEDLIGYYFVQFPDIENAVTQGKNLKDARNMAIEILNLALIEMENDSEKISPSKSLKVFQLDDGAFVEEIVADTDAFRELLKVADDYVHYEVWYSPKTNKKFFVYKDENEEVCEKLSNTLREIAGIKNNE